MAEDWAIDVRKYAPDADGAVIQAIVRYCGIALQSRDASLVSFTDKTETDRVRENYCRKKLGLTQTDAELDMAIARVGERMDGDNTKNRVTVYYLLAEMFGKLGLFGAVAPVAAMAAPAPTPVEPVAPTVAPTVVPVAPPAPVAPVVAAAAMAPVAAAAAAPIASHAPTPARRRQDDGMFTTGIVTAGLVGAGILGAATAAFLVMNNGNPTLPPEKQVIVAGEIPSTLPPGPAATVAIPEGSGVVAQEVEGKPQLSVYFDTSSTEISPDFAAAAAPIKAYVDANPGARLAVSGYNDPRGDAAMNAELSKNRAKSVAAALAALGVPEGAIDLVKPPETTDDTTTLENARRVDIVVADAG